MRKEPNRKPLQFRSTRFVRIPNNNSLKSFFFLELYASPKKILAFSVFNAKIMTGTLVSSWLLHASPADTQSSVKIVVLR
jgi:hypothetical protein